MRGTQREKRPQLFSYHGTVRGFCTNIYNYPFSSVRLLRVIALYDRLFLLTTE